VRAQDARGPKPVCGDTLAEHLMEAEAQAVFERFPGLKGANVSNSMRHRIIDDALRERLRQRCRGGRAAHSRVAAEFAATHPARRLWRLRFRCHALSAASEMELGRGRDLRTRSVEPLVEVRQAGATFRERLLTAPAARRRLWAAHAHVRPADVHCRKTTLYRHSPGE
jgi:hypothetical protein